jgi:hypothetical protein
VSGTRRTPLDRPPVAQITPRAVDLFIAMGKLRCTCPPPPPEYWKHKICVGCERWYDLHGLLDDELGCEPWEWPCVARQGPKHAGSTCMNEGIAARMAALKAAAKARRAATATRRTASLPLDEEDTNAPVAGEDTLS